MFYAASKILWFFATPSNGLPILTLVGLLLMLWGPARSFGYGLALAGVVLLLVAGLSPLASWVIRPLDDRFPTFQDDGGPVTGIIVLGGAAQVAGELLAPSAHHERGRRNPIVLADLAWRHPLARLIFSGGSGVNLLTEDRPNRGRACIFGHAHIPGGRLEIETQSHTTSENAEFTRRLVEPKPGERWLLVTSRAGTCRAPWAAFARSALRSPPIRWISAPAGPGRHPRVPIRGGRS